MENNNGTHVICCDSGMKGLSGFTGHPGVSGIAYTDIAIKPATSEYNLAEIHKILEAGKDKIISIITEAMVKGKIVIEKGTN